MEANPEAQWIDATLPVGTSFELDRLVDLRRMVPDCGYELRYVEVTAVGTLEEVDCDDCDSGRSHELVVRGGGARLELEGLGAFDDAGPSDVQVIAAITPPFGDHLRLLVTSVLPAVR